MIRSACVWVLVLGVSLAPSGARAQQSEETPASEDAVRAEIRALRARGGPVLHEAGITAVAGLGLGAITGIGYVVIALADGGLYGGSDPSTPGSVMWFASYGGFVLAGAGVALALTGLIWLIERAGPYQADAPRRDRIQALRIELRDRRARVSMLPDLRALPGGAFGALTVAF